MVTDKWFCFLRTAFGYDAQPNGQCRYPHGDYFVVKVWMPFVGHEACGWLNPRGQIIPQGSEKYQDPHDGAW